MMQCPKCLYRVFDFEKDDDDEECPLCGHTMNVTKKEEKQTDEEDPRTTVEYELQTGGDEATWNKIEKIAYTKKRLLYRKYFFEFGGVVPKKHLVQTEDELWDS